MARLFSSIVCAIRRSVRFLQKFPAILQLRSVPWLRIQDNPVRDLFSQTKMHAFGGEWLRLSSCFVPAMTSRNTLGVVARSCFRQTCTGCTACRGWNRSTQSQNGLMVFVGVGRNYHCGCPFRFRLPGGCGVRAGISVPTVARPAFPASVPSGCLATATDSSARTLPIKAIRQSASLGEGDRHVMLVADLELQGVELGLLEMEP